VFLTALGIVYLVAFSSLAGQVVGLVGHDGIAPVADLLERVGARRGVLAFHTLPTLFWLAHGDAALRLVCWGGALLAVLLVLDVAPLPVLVLLWVFYLTLQTTCDVFLHYQWDILLLETGFLAIFLAPLHLRPGRVGTAPPTAVIWLLRWLLFRLMLLSGLVKWLSGDPAWGELTALEFHYETQPLPTWIAWYAHQLPRWCQRASALTMFVIEIVLPWGIFGPPRLRVAVAVVFVSFQLAIMATGNYGFFNLLTIALSLTLLDDAAWPGRWRQAAGVPGRMRRWPHLLIVPLAIGVFLLSLPPAMQRLGVSAPWPGAVRRLQDWVAPFRIANAYGLFTVMTKRRREITVEGSRDGRTWIAYRFRWKPGDPFRRPAFVHPHQPRIDWQMWFAALAPFERQWWFQRFLLQLLEGSPSVLALLEGDPFSDGPPRYVRATISDYRFTSGSHPPGNATGRDAPWWNVGPPGPYSPTLSRRNPQAD
jgi:hypothetical protein